MHTTMHCVRVYIFQLICKEASADLKCVLASQLMPNFSYVGSWLFEWLFRMGTKGRLKTTSINHSIFQQLNLILFKSSIVIVYLI